MPNDDNKSFTEKVATWAALLIMMVVAMIIITVFNLTQTLPIDYELTQEDYNGLFLNLGVIAIVIERLIEVFNSVWRRKGRVSRTLALTHAKSAEAKMKAERDLEDYRSDTGTYAMYMGLILGLIVSISGVHTLQIIYDTSELVGWQLLLFRAVDVLLTAGLLAGGSKGINGVTDVLSNLLDGTARRAAEVGKKPESDQ